MGGKPVCPFILEATKTLRGGEKTPPGANMKAVFERVNSGKAESGVTAVRKLIGRSCVARSRAILDICFAFQEAFKPVAFVREEVSPPSFWSNHLGPLGRGRILLEPATVLARGW
jgi:hypothetical protein